MSEFSLHLLPPSQRSKNVFRTRISKCRNNVSKTTINLHDLMVNPRPTTWQVQRFITFFFGHGEGQHAFRVSPLGEKERKRHGFGFGHPAANEAAMRFHEDLKPRAKTNDLTSYSNAVRPFGNVAVHDPSSWTRHNKFKLICKHPCKPAWPSA